MIVSRIKLKNWKNFREVDVELGNRVFLVGPNASGKSNFLDAFRFLRDIVSPQGGSLQRAVNDRGGLSKIRCLGARKDPEVALEVHLSEEPLKPPKWKYALGIVQESGGHKRPKVRFEKAWRDDTLVFGRPNVKDEQDKELLTQTHLEQISMNVEYRAIASFFQSVQYLHLVPQLIRFPKHFTGPGFYGDPFGRSFLQRISKTSSRTRQARLRKIETALGKVVPQLKDLQYLVDSSEGGVPHLEATCEHWRPNAGRQRETEFSDGTLRLIGLFWTLLEKDSLLLMEEPELSLNASIIRQLPSIFGRLTKKSGRQIVVSTHSFELMNSEQIGANEVLILSPEKEGTRVQPASNIQEVKVALESGLTIADVVLPRTEPQKVEELESRLFAQ